MTSPELIAKAKNLRACEPALKAAAGYTDLGTYCRDYPIYAAWMIYTEPFWNSLTAEQRWQVCVAAPWQAIYSRYAWDSLAAEQQQQLCVAAPWAAIYYRHAWDSLTAEQRGIVAVAAPGPAIRYRHAWDSLTAEQQQHIKALVK